MQNWMTLRLRDTNSLRNHLQLSPQKFSVFKLKLIQLALTWKTKGVFIYTCRFNKIPWWATTKIKPLRQVLSGKATLKHASGQLTAS